jgi:hypothetical protein
MHKRRTPILSIVTLLSICLTATAAVSQTKPTTTNPRQKAAPVVAKAIPPIKCTDADSMAACKSFKQLVDSSDKGLLDSLTGGRDSQERHFAYVCLLPKQDVFKIVEFDEPLPTDFRPFETNGREWIVELGAFPSAKAKSYTERTQLMDAGKKWFNDHNESSGYAIGTVYVQSWENGIMADYVSDWGKWRLPFFQGNVLSKEEATFESAHEWLEHFNKDNDGKLALADDRAVPRILISDSSVYVNYSFENRSNAFTDYTLSIHRSTGRFTESYVATGLDPFEKSGTCMVFKFELAVPRTTRSMK